MWLLISEKGELFRVSPKQEHIVSRKVGSIVLNDDQSISRQHAKIILNSDDENNNSGLSLVDLSSKYGTFVNEGIETSNGINPNESVILKHDDVVRFGLQWNKWRVIFMQLVVITSMINKQQKSELKCQIEKLCGKFKSNWGPDCTHLTMNQITLTVKVVSALAAGQYIVTPQYWKDLLKAVESKVNQLPDPNNYIPPLNETTLNESQVSFSVNKQRSSLFSSLLFITSTSSQKKQIEPMITAAGGKVIDFTECKLRKEDLCKEGIILMQVSSIVSPGNSQLPAPPGYIDFSKYLLSKGHRCIPESDIGLSVVYCSRERFCNPTFKAHNIFENFPAPEQQTEASNIIVKDTEEIRSAPQSSIGKIINETTIEPISPLSASQRKRAITDDSEEEQVPFKKPQKTNVKSKQKTVLESVNNVHSSNSQNNTKQSSVKNITDDSDKEKEVIGADIEMDNDFSFSKNSIKPSSLGATRINSVQDIFATSSKSENMKSVGNPESVDMFGSTKSNDQKLVEGTNKPTTSLNASMKKSVDMFEISTSKKSYNLDDDFEFQTSATKSKCDAVLIDDDDDFGFENKSKTKRKCMALKDDDDDDDFGFETKEQIMSKQSINSDKEYQSNNKVQRTAKRQKVILEDENEDFVYRNESKNLLVKDCISDSDENDDDDFVYKSTKKSEESKQNVTEVQSNNDNSVRSLNNESNSKIFNPFETSLKSTNRVTDSQDIFQPSSSKCSAKRSKFIDDSEDLLVRKKPKYNTDTINHFPAVNNSNEIYCEGNLLREIKQEPGSTIIKDETLHDSAVVIVKSLIGPMRDISILDVSDTSSRINGRVNFKKFRKATPVKLPDLVSLKPYSTDDNRDISMDETHKSIDLSDVDEDEDAGWSYKNTQTNKQTKRKQKMRL